MFQFTREFIINDNGTGVAGTKGLLKDGKRFEVNNDTLMVARMVNLKKNCIVSASKVAGAAAVNEKVELTPSVTVAKDTIVRLVITIGRQGSITALVNDYHPLHKKQYFYEAEVATANTLPLDAFVAIADKEADMEAPDRLIKVSKDGSKLVVEALDPYTRINEVRIVSVPKDPERGVAEILTGYMDYDMLVLWKKVFGSTVAKATGVSAISFTAGSEGAGTVALILKNKRLLTDANIDPYGYDLDERPVPGALYDQYLVEYVTERRHIGGQVFGAIDQSLTSFVFFVNQAVSAAFATELAKVATVDATNAETKLPEDIMAVKATTKATIPTGAVDGTNPAAAVELSLS